MLSCELHRSMALLLICLDIYFLIIFVQKYVLCIIYIYTLYMPFISHLSSSYSLSVTTLNGYIYAMVLLIYLDMCYLNILFRTMCYASFIFTVYICVSSFIILTITHLFLFLYYLSMYWTKWTERYTERNIQKIYRKFWRIVCYSYLKARFPPISQHIFPWLFLDFSIFFPDLKW